MDATTMGRGPLPKITRIVWRMVPSAGIGALARSETPISPTSCEQDFTELKSTPSSAHFDPYSNGNVYLRNECHQSAFDNLKFA